MPKAQITTKSGTKVTIEGTAEEVAAMVATLEGGVADAPRPTRAEKQTGSTKAKTRAATLAGPSSLVIDLIDGGYFKKPKELGAIRLTLQEQGHFFPVTTLSPLMLRLVRNRQLRRIKDKNRWLYVG